MVLDRLLTTFAWPFAAALALVPCHGESSPVPRRGAHAHNDYEHPRPLLDALDHGFQSVEADVFVIDGDLLVAHDREDVRSDRTLKALYLEPLWKRFQVNEGKIYPASYLPFYLMIDFKSDAERTYDVLKEQLKDYRPMLTEFSDDQIIHGAVTVVISGNRPAETMAGEAVRLAGVDGRLSDLERVPRPRLMPWISDRWGNVFSWNGQGEMSGDERKRLADLVERTHARGQKLRFWAVPDHEAGWRILEDAGVDFLNTDRLEAMRAFLLEQREE